MNQRRIIFAIICALLLSGGSYLVANNQAARTLAADTAGVSISLDNSLGSNLTKTTDELIAFWHGRFKRDPRDYISLTYLGQAYLRKARETGDAGAYIQAEAALRQALARKPDDEKGMAYLATVLFAQHNFREALEMASQVYARDPRASQALATLGDAQLEMGRYDEAAAAYQKLLAQAPSPPVYSRLANLAWLQGHPPNAIHWMQQAANEAIQLELAGESVAWYYVQLGDLYFNTGQFEVAAKHYTTAGKLFDNYYLPLAGLGKVRAAQGRYDQAIDLYEQATAIIPQPDLLAALGDLYTLTGQLDKAKLQYDTVEYTGKLARINRQIYNRQLANFYADHDLNLDEALTLALNELEYRQDVYGFDTAAWAYYKNGRPNEARQMMEQALRLGTRDAKLFYHAGMIAKALGQTAQARQLLSQALAINPHFDPLQAPLAQNALEQLPPN